jgi:hypothetical protein
MSFLLTCDRIGDLHRDEGRLRCQLLLPPTQKARSDPIAAGHLRGARVGSGCFFENPQLVCVIEPAPMPLTGPWNGWGLSEARRDKTPDEGEG